LSKLATTNGSQFFVGDCFGFCGAAMMDLGPTLEYRPEQGKQLLDPIKVKDYVPLEQIVQVPLHQATNRFHKSPPPVWIQYRCLLEYQQKKGTWPSSVSADDDNDGDTFDETIMQDFLKEQQVTPTMMTSEELQTLAKVGMAQVAPVCAVLGGMLGNEIIKVISGKGEPANNTILLDGNKCKSWTFLVKPKEA
jgi:ubiquitin-like 1-activating enzyme E1 A